VTPKVKGGDVLCIPSGVRGRIIVKNIVGSPGNPVVIKNCGGQAVLSAGTANVNTFLMQYSRYFKITGAGHAGTLYGIKITGGQNGLVLSELCSNFEVDHVEVSGCGFAGFMAKTDPICADSMTWRKNFTMRDVSFHHNYSHDVQGEGFYIGNSFYNSTAPGTVACGGKSPHSIEGVEVYRNVVKRTGCEGIQVGSARKNCRIHDNTVDTTGLNPFASFQNNGIQIGSGSGGLCYNNWMNFCPGNGIVCTGIGDNVIFNNIIINPGADTAKLGFGIFMDEQNTADSILGSGMKFINNTIINPRTNGIRIYTDRLPQSYILNNIIVLYGNSPGYVQKLNNSINVLQQGNVFRNTLSVLGFTNVSTNDFRLNSGSPAIGVGVNASIHGVNFDFNNSPRGAIYDAGAFAYTSTSIPTSDTTSVEEKLGYHFFVYPNPLNLNGQLTLKFYLEKSAHIGFTSYDLTGKLIGESSPVFYLAGWNEWKINDYGAAPGAVVFQMFQDGLPKDSQIVMIH
ncbi:MAG: right-handed parallel beta-helix repeat-containing protein, partial [Cytophagales bacterium]|nr:right-handed parallel beta-helix repeat-containing protein [Cytophagales bacterium]